MVGRDEAEMGSSWKCCLMYSRAFFIRAIAHLNYPRVYSRHTNDLRMMSTSSFNGFMQFSNLETTGYAGLTGIAWR